jgi:hypothetical protein
MFLSLTDKLIKQEVIQEPAHTCFTQYSIKQSVNLIMMSIYV